MALSAGLLSAVRRSPATTGGASRRAGRCAPPTGAGGRARAPAAPGAPAATPAARRAAPRPPRPRRGARPPGACTRPSAPGAQNLRQMESSLDFDIEINTPQCISWNQIANVRHS